MVEVLQVRVNHNMCRVPIKNNGGNMTIVSLEFTEDCFGSITISNNQKAGALKCYLYRQNDENILKLVGKAQ